MGAARATDIDRDFYRLGEARGSNPDVVGGFSRPRPGRAERLAAGRALRQTVPRSSHGDWAPAAGRADPVAVIAAQNRMRVQKLVPIRMERMTASPFAFLRGAAAIMAGDLAGSPVTDLDVMAGGDMHLANFGLFASAERQLVFAINDFDEVHPGPWEWDVKRLAASVAVAALHVGGTRGDAATASEAASRAYVQHMRRYAQMGYLEIWYDRIDEASIMAASPPQFARDLSKTTGKARKRGHIRSFGKLTEMVDGVLRIADDPPLITHETHLDGGEPMKPALDAMLISYLRSLPDDRARLLSRYRLLDVARKVVGVGSVGTSCWVLLLQGESDADPLFLQVKEARESVLAVHLKRKVKLSNQGRRVVVGQRMIQGSSDIFLGWGPTEGKSAQGHYYVRQLADMKGGARFNAGDREWVKRLPAHAALCGWALALAHAKSGDPAMISGYCGTGDAFPDAVARFAMAYADLSERDHDLVVKAVRAGLL